MKKEYLKAAPNVVIEFLTYNEAIKNKSSATIDEYFLDLQTFFRYIKSVKGLVTPDTDFEDIEISDISIDLIKTITINDLYAFLVFCKNERNNNATTRARKATTLRRFFKYLSVQTNQIDENPAELLESPKVKKSLPKYLTLDEATELLNSVKDETNPNYKRDFCILTLFLNCGMRLSELCNLNVTDIRSDNTIRILGKGNKERTIYLNDACTSALSDYLPVRPTNDIKPEYKDALFISRNKRRLSNKTVQHIVYTNLEKIGMGGRGYSVHKLRHTAATLMYQYGNVDIRILQDLLGHENLGTTQIYTHVADNQLKKAMDANPLSKPNK